MLWAGELVSAIGGELTSFGLGVYVFQRMGSAAGMALVTLFGLLPTLAQICLGVLVSSVFSSLLEPSYRATISDLLTKEEFSKASGLVSLAGSARYLVSPVIAGFLLSVAEIRVLLVIDIATFFLTVASTAVVKRGLKTKRREENDSFFASLREGWDAVHSREGLFLLILMSSVLTLFMGVFQILAEPLILAFADAKTLGIGETVCACGMLASGLLLGVRGIRRNYVAVLGVSLAAAGLCMVGFGIRENMVLICGFGFAFFAMLPFANSCLDYLVRTNIREELQGRAWGLIGFLSQIGYVVAYGLAGMMADLAGKTLRFGVGEGLR